MNSGKDVVKAEVDYGNQWKERAEYRFINRRWLDYSRKIALRIMAAIQDIPEMNQRILAEQVGVSPQQISKIIKGQENLTLQTIAKFSEILRVELISFPAFKYNQNISLNFNVGSIDTIFVIIENVNTSSHIMGVMSQEIFEFSTSSTMLTL